MEEGEPRVEKGKERENSGWLFEDFPDFLPISVSEPDQPSSSQPMEDFPGDMFPLDF